ncbi:MAG: hypothetical protein Q9173_001334, partial [Seirophora scorigena]
QVKGASNSEAWFDCVRSLAVENGPINQLRLALEELAKRLKPKKRLKNITHAFTWPFDQAYCEDLLGKIERVKSSVSLALQEDTLTLAKAIKADTSAIPNINERISLIAADIRGLKLTEDYPARGAGKSILASIIVDHLRTLHKNDSLTGIAAVYCKFKERELQGPESLLAGCCAQLLQTSPEPLSDILVNAYNTHDTKKTRPSWKDMVEIFKACTTTFNTVFLIADALDECSKAVRDVLLTYFNVLPSNVRLAVTTRHIDEITRQI